MAIIKIIKKRKIIEAVRITQIIVNNIKSNAIIVRFCY
jgi:hypothetical protein